MPGSGAGGFPDLSQRLHIPDIHDAAAHAQEDHGAGQGLQNPHQRVEQGGDDSGYGALHAIRHGRAEQAAGHRRGNRQQELRQRAQVLGLWRIECQAVHAVLIAVDRREPRLGQQAGVQERLVFALRRLGRVDPRPGDQQFYVRPPPPAPAPEFTYGARSAGKTGKPCKDGWI